MKLKNNFNLENDKNNNLKKNDHIWYKNKMLMDEIQRQISSIKDSRLNTSQLKEWKSNLI